MLGLCNVFMLQKKKKKKLIMTWDLMTWDVTCHAAACAVS